MVAMIEWLNDPTFADVSQGALGAGLFFLFVGVGVGHLFARKRKP